MDMRIGIIAAAYKVGWGYIDNMLAELVPLNGHTVRVFAAGRRNTEPELISSADGHGHTLQRVPARRLPRSVWCSLRDVAPAMREFDPGAILWVGPTRYFGRAVMSDPKLMSVPVASFFTECAGWHEFDWRTRSITPGERLRALAYRCLRGPMVRAACRRSQLVVGVTPETREILLSLFPPGPARERIRQKTMMLPLGFQPGVTRWDPPLRQQLREELGFAADDVVVALSSRFAPDKAELLKTMVSGIQGAMERDPRLRGLLIGLDEAPTSREIRNLIEEGAFSRRFTCHEFTDQVRMNALFNAADVALFGNCSNSCQSALGTGLFACFADNGTMNHLIPLPHQGVLFLPNDVDDLIDKLLASAQAIAGHDGGREAFRGQLAQASSWLGYDRIIGEVLSRLEAVMARDSGKTKRITRSAAPLPEQCGPTA